MKLRLINAFLFFVSITSLSCSDNPVLIDESNLEIWPMKVGNYWIFKTTYFDSLGQPTIESPFKVRFIVSRETTLSSIKMYKIDWYSPWEGLGMGYWTNKADGLHVVESLDSVPPLTKLLYHYPAKVGETVDKKIITSIDTSIITPLGTFICYAYTTYYTSATYYIFFSPGFGRIKEEAIIRTRSGKNYVLFKEELIECRIQ